MPTALKAVQPTSPTELQLVEEYLAAKGHLDVAKKIFAEKEASILAHFGSKPEGSHSVWVADKFKVTTTGKITRAVDLKAWRQVTEQIPAPLADRVVRFKPELNLRELRYVEENEKDWFSIIAKAVTSKPAKASVKVEVKE